MSTLTSQSIPPAPPADGWPGGKVVAAVAVTVLAVLLILHYAGGDGDEARRADHTPTIAADGLSQGRLTVSGGTDRLTVTTADLGGDLVQAQTPTEQSAVPVLQEAEDGVVSVSTRAGDNGGGAGTDLTVRLAKDVRWVISIDGGTSLLTLDLQAGQVQSLDVRQGVAGIEAMLPHPEGVLPLRVSGGANIVRVVVPPGVPTRATFEGGAGSAVIDGVEHEGLSGGAVLTSPESYDEEAKDRIELMMDSGIGGLHLISTP